jgi:DNA-binding transcriptional LysR family regulator
MGDAKMVDSSFRVDLNLIKVFIAIYESNSVTQAAARLFLTQPTVSFSLAKLRDTFQDTLFVRGANGMMPTVVAELAYARFKVAIDHIDSAIEISRGFAPETSSHRFRVAMTALGMLIFMPLIMRRIEQEAPGVEIEVVQVAVSELDGWLATGKADVVLGNLPALEATTRSVMLFSERYACLLRENHPTIGETLDLPAFVQARHVLVTPPFSGHHLEDSLQQLGIHRKIALQLPHFTLLPQLISETDLVITLPSRVAKMFLSYGNLRMLEIPVAIPYFEVKMYWHAQHAEKAAHCWLRNMLSETLNAL